MPQLAGAAILAPVPLFSSDSARAAGAKGNATQARLRAAAGIHRAQVAELAAIPSEYASSRLIRVRDLLNQIDSQLAAELLRAVPDSRRLKELADAAHRLQEQERTLAGRPLPGSRRPGEAAAPAPRPGLPTPR